MRRALVLESVALLCWSACSASPAAHELSTETASAGGEVDGTGGAQATNSGGSREPYRPGGGTSAGSSGSGGTASDGGGAEVSGGRGGGPHLTESCSVREPGSPAPASTWTNATGNLAGMTSGCANLAMIAAKPCSSSVIAGVVRHGLWTTQDSGKTWTALGSGPGSAVVTNTTTSIVFDPRDPNVFWETGLHSGPGLYRSGDGGAVFTPLGSMIFSQLVSVDFQDRERKTLLVGTHGERQKLYLSKDAGATWDNIGLHLSADTHQSESPLIIDQTTFLLGACGHSAAYVCGILRSTDGGATWISTSRLKVSHYGAPLWASDGSIYWPLFDDAGIAKSTDRGLTWTRVLDSAVGVTPAELPDGSIVTVGKDGAANSLVRSKDGGSTWRPIGEPLPFAIGGYADMGALAYSAGTKTFFYSHWDCGDVVLPNAIMKAGFDWE